jgi:hypothetical protein
MKQRGLGNHRHSPPKKDALEFGSIGGTQNNLAQPDLSSAGIEFAQVGPVKFAGGFLTPGDCHTNTLVDPTTGVPEHPATAVNSIYG